MSRGRALLGTLLSAAAYGLAFPPLGWHLLAWCTLAPFFAALRGASVRRALALGALWGVGAAYSVGTWMPVAVTRYYQQPVVVGIAAFVLCAVVTVVPYSVGFALLCRRIAGRGFGGLEPVLVGAAWAASELWRARSPLGNPWSLLGYAQTPVLPVVQIADLGGVFAVCFVVATVNAALASLVAAWNGPPATWPAARRGAGVAAGVLACTLSYGGLRLGDGGNHPVATPVAVVQGNVDLGAQWQPEMYGENLEAYLRLTDDALARRPARLVVWPENALTFFLEDERAYRIAIARVLAANGADQLLTGGPRTVRDEGGVARYLNAAFVLDARGEIGAVYEKRHLVPFAENFPLPALDVLRRRFGRVREFVAGTRQDPLPTVAGDAGILICNEAFYGEVAAERVRRGATVLVNLTNDGWVGEEGYAAIAFAMSRLRAVETRRWLVRSSTSGPSAVIDPYGRVTAAAALDTRAVLDATVAARAGETPYTRAGDAFGWACTLVAMAAAVRRA